MVETIAAKGQCVCGAVSFTTDNMSTSVGACHCKMCRQWGGGPFMEVDCGTEVVYMGEENIGIFNSSDWAERGFCKQCGTHLFYRLKEMNLHIIPVGIFDDGIDFVFEKQVFYEEKPHYYQFLNDTENMNGDELIEQFNNSSD